MEQHEDGLYRDTNVAIQERVNALHKQFIDDRAKAVDWWLTTMIGVLGLLSIAVVIIGYISWDKLDEMTEKGEKVIEELEKFRDQYRSQLAELDAARVAEDLPEATRTAEGVQRDPEASVIDRARAAAVLFQQQGKIAEALEKWRAIANIVGEEDRPLRARAWFSIGYLLNDEELEAKIDAYTKAIELNPAYAEAYVNRGSAKNSLGQHQAAIADYTRAIALNPTDAEAYYNRGNTKNSLGQYKEAIADFDRALELDPADADAYNNRGLAKSNLGQYKEAIADFDRAVALSPTDTDAYVNRGNAKNNLGQYVEAIADLDKALALEPTNALAYNNRGFAKENLGRLDEARADYQKALVLAQEVGNEKVVTMAKSNLSRLDSNAEP